VVPAEAETKVGIARVAPAAAIVLRKFLRSKVIRLFRRELRPYTDTSTAPKRSFGRVPSDCYCKSAMHGQAC